MSGYKTLDILEVKVNDLNEITFLKLINDAIDKNEKITIGYANADTLNKIYEDKELKNIFKSFDIIHPDGTGIYIASRFLYNNSGLEKRFTGSDFYPELISESIKHNWKYFFFGHSNDVLSAISSKFPKLNISGFNEGYNFENDNVISKINSARPDILIIGLSCPVQERWIFRNKDLINCKVILAVGDGIKIFAGKKIRGPLIFRKAGLEWVFRVISNPSVNFKRYITGIPKFIFRVLKSSALRK